MHAGGTMFVLQVFMGVFIRTPAPPQSISALLLPQTLVIPFFGCNVPGFPVHPAKLFITDHMARARTQMPVYIRGRQGRSALSPRGLCWQNKASSRGNDATYGGPATGTPSRDLATSCQGARAPSIFPHAAASAVCNPLGPRP